jgi:phenylalanyl-tRNA synthetase alpha subunit
MSMVRMAMVMVVAVGVGWNHLAMLYYNITDV